MDEWKRGRLRLSEGLQGNGERQDSPTTEASEQHRTRHGQLHIPAPAQVWADHSSLTRIGDGGHGQAVCSVLGHADGGKDRGEERGGTVVRVQME